MGSIIVERVAKRTLSAIQAVRCERCRQPYFYEVIRTAAGRASSFLGLDKLGTLDQAERQAESNVRDALVTAHDPVPCPACGHVQDAAVDDIRSRHATRARDVLLRTGFFVAAVTAGALFGVVKRSGKPDDQAILIVGSVIVAEAVLFAIALAVVYLRGLDRAKFDALPADHWLRWAQPALIERQDAEGFYYVPAKRIDAIRQGDAVIAQIHRIGLPSNCAHCCAPAARDFAPPVAISEHTKTYPCCEACQRRAARQWWGWFAVAALAGVAACAGVAQLVSALLLPASTPTWLRWTLLVGIGLPATAVLALYVPNVIGRPLVRRHADRGRGWVSLRAKQPEFRRLLEQHFTRPLAYTVRGKGMPPVRPAPSGA